MSDMARTKHIGDNSGNSRPVEVGIVIKSYLRCDYLCTPDHTSETSVCTCVHTCVCRSILYLKTLFI